MVDDAITNRSQSPHGEKVNPGEARLVPGTMAWPSTTTAGRGPACPVVWEAGGEIPADPIKPGSVHGSPIPEPVATGRNGHIAGKSLGPGHSHASSPPLWL